MHDDLNPYASPAESAAHRDVRRRCVDGTPQSQLIEYGLLHRRVQIEIPVECTIEFFGRSSWRDIVRLDGRIVTQKISWVRIASELSFTMLTDRGNLSVQVLLDFGWFLRMKRFRILMDGQTVYEDRGHPEPHPQRIERGWSVTS